MLLLQQQQQQQQHQRFQQQQQQQQQQNQQQSHMPQQGPSGLGMSPMASLGRSGMPGSAIVGNQMSGMGGMAGLRSQGNLGSMTNAPNFQGMPVGMANGIQRVPSQTGQHGQPPQGGSGGMNMNMLGAMNGSMGMNAMNRPGGMPGAPPARQPQMSFPGTGPPPQGGPGQLQQAGHAHGQLSPEFANIINRQRMQDTMTAQQPRAGSVPGPNGPVGMGPGAQMNAVGMQRAPSAQSMGAPGGVHQGHPNMSNHAGQGHNQPNPPPFANPLQNQQQHELNTYQWP